MGNKKILTGLTDQHIDQNYGIHKEVVESFLDFCDEIASFGSQIKIVSGFRSYERQLLIWNQKAQGKREILDQHGNPLNYNQLTKEELLFSILRWSALPGTSRHHWGTDFDIIDQSSIEKDYKVQLTSDEFEKGGPFYQMHLHIQKYIKKHASSTFFRPYDQDLGGVFPERWHLSFRPLSETFQKEYSFEFFSQFLEEQDPDQYLLLPLIKQHQEKIYQQFIINICS